MLQRARCYAGARLDAGAKASHLRTTTRMAEPYHRSLELQRCIVAAQLSNFARSLSVETAFTVLAMARSLKAAGKDVVELEIGDSPFDSTAAARAGGMEAIEDNQTHYCPSPGLPEFREAAAEFVRDGVRHPGRAREHRGRPGRQGVRAVLLRGLLEPRRRRAGLQPAFPDLRPEHRAPRRARRADAADGRRTASARPSPTSSGSSTTTRRRAPSS